MKYLFLVGSFLISLVGYEQSWAKIYDRVDKYFCGLSIVGKGDKHGFVNKE